jgi:hypothetical protein
MPDDISHIIPYNPLTLLTIAYTVCLMYGS